jgi:Cdc6-like AAA superfamily ATPase
MANDQDKIQLSFEASRVFSPGAPIDERALFAGRLDQTRQVLGAISQRGHHAIIYGERGVGKTSLSFVLSEFLEDAGQTVIAPRVNCDGSDTFTSIWKKIFSEITFSRETKGIGFLSQPQVVTTNFADTLPDNLRPDAVRKALTLLCRGATLIIIIDEFDRMPNGTTSPLFADTIKMLSDHSVSATLVLVGVADSVDELIKEHESIERSLVQIHMPRMSKGELHEIIQRGLQRLDMAIDPRAMEQISTLSQGLPHYTHLLALNATHAAIDENTKKIDEALVDKAIRVSLDNAQQSIRSVYHKATASPRSDNLYTQVLLACALSRTDDLGYFAAAAVRDPLTYIMNKKYDIPSFSRHLKEFCEDKRGPVLRRFGQKHRVRFRFINPLMQPYVTMHGYAGGQINKDILAHLDQLRLK